MIARNSVDLLLAVTTQVGRFAIGFAFLLLKLA
jgi:hypothetical protein